MTTVTAFKKIPAFLMAVLCASSLLAVFPVIGDHAASPNLVSYFNADEGLLTDNLWFYYSGKKLPTYEMSLDYGLELVYVADLVRMTVGKVMDVTPGQLIVIVRWLHILAWMAGLIAAWYLVKVHFGDSWKPLLVVLLLSVRPAFDHCMNTMKPEPLVLLFVIVGLTCALKIIDEPLKKGYFFIACALAAMALVVKFAGIFLLPAIVAALYFRDKISGRIDLPAFWEKNPWFLPFILSIPFFLMPLADLFFYVRKASGLTYYQEFGFVEGIVKNKIIFLFWAAGLALVAASLILFILNRCWSARILKWISRINYYFFITGAVFTGFVFLFGFKWLFIPGQFLEIYTLTFADMSGADALASMAPGQNYLSAFFQSVIEKAGAFDVFILLLAVLWFLAEMSGRRSIVSKTDRAARYKRWVLFIYIVPCLLLVTSAFGLGRFARHNMLPFFVPAAILAVEGVYLWANLLAKRRAALLAMTGFCSALLFSDVVLNAHELAQKRIARFQEKNDVVFEVTRWWRDNVPADALILAEHPRITYLPEGYKNVKIIKRVNCSLVKGLYAACQGSSPKYIFIAETTDPEEALVPHIYKLFPKEKISLIKIFDNNGRPYQKSPGTKYYIFEVR